MTTKRTKPSSLRYYLDGPPDPTRLVDWSLTISGSDRAVAVTRDEISSRCEVVHMERRFVCVCNWSVVHTWDGFLLADVLAAFLGYDGDGKSLHLYQQGIGTQDKGQYDASVCLGQAIENNALLVTGIDGAALTIERGAPMRFIDFSCYGYKCVKGLERLEIRTEPFESIWERTKGYDSDGTVLPRRYNCVDLDATVLLGLYGEQDVIPAGWDPPQVM